ncbi:helix-turn-helix domain-containing protein [Curvibacter sp. RS43]|uniref:helix-turn-helix domain-containing protein n=1 Tax=Curvibacter microcysteis TaxID=3026419 RepID=UPI002360001B|nr:helix-turn-helix domain-containing protein [Curvibacter sp. RS43]MDD0811001.1 helix-turn-helix domain-containing protein [Curvibacter sp. RS43]
MASLFGPGGHACPDAPALASPERARFRLRHSADVDEHAAQLSAWDQEYDQLSSGRFAGRVRELWLDGPRLQVFHEHTSQETSQQCAPWQGSVWFGLPDLRCQQPLHFCGHAQDAQRGHALLSARASDGFALRTPADFGIYGVVLDQTWLQEQADALGLKLSPRLDRPAQATPLSASRHAELCQTLETLLSLAQSGDAQQRWGQATLQALLTQLLQGLCGDLAEAGPSPAQRASQRRLALVMAARELARQPSGEALSVDALCQQLHLTRRTLQNHFQSVLGESPADFLKAVRLNACRRRLREPSAPDKVQDVAAQWGFFHMGHFSQDYKDLFGELPSQTLRQRAPSHGHA